MAATDRDDLRADPSDHQPTTGDQGSEPRLRRTAPRRRKVFALRWPSVSGLTARILAINLVGIVIWIPETGPWVRRVAAADADHVVIKP